MACHFASHCSGTGCLLFNILLAQKLPLIEGIILVIHCFGFFGILIPLWVLSPRPAASEVLDPLKIAAAGEITVLLVWLGWSDRFMP